MQGGQTVASANQYAKEDSNPAKYITRRMASQFRQYVYIVCYILPTPSAFLVNTLYCDPSNAEATFVQSTRMLKSLKTIETLSCWYSFKSSC